MKCVNCGRKLPEHSLFCNFCGTNQIIKEIEMEDTEQLVEKSEMSHVVNDPKEENLEQTPIVSPAKKHFRKSTRVLLVSLRATPHKKGIGKSPKMI